MTKHYRQSIQQFHGKRADSIDRRHHTQPSVKKQICMTACKFPIGTCYRHRAIVYGKYLAQATATEFYLWLERCRLWLQADWTWCSTSSCPHPPPRCCWWAVKSCSVGRSETRRDWKIRAPARRSCSMWSNAWFLYVNTIPSFSKHLVSSSFKPLVSTGL